MTLLHSKDLVNWEIYGNIIDDLTQISEDLNWTRMDRYGRGVWAGTLRHYNGRFYLFFGTPDEGYFMTSASRAEGPWEPLTPLLPEPGWDDCTAMWDENGKAYFVGTHFADGYKTYLFKMSEDGKSIDRKSAKLINSGSGREASKLIKVNGWYYLIFSEHKPGVGRYVMAKRSRKLAGPYKEEKQLALPSCEAMEPNQGGIILGKDNNWYFLTHHGTGDWSGRIVSLLPVTWVQDWPIPGEVLPQNIGTMKWDGKIPFKHTEKLSIKRRGIRSARCKRHPGSYPDNSITFPTGGRSSQSGAQRPRSGQNGQRRTSGGNQRNRRPSGGQNRNAQRRPQNAQSRSGQRMRPVQGQNARRDPVRREGRKKRKLTRAAIRRRRLMRRLTALVMLLCVIGAGVYLTVTMLAIRN